MRHSSIVAVSFCLAASLTALADEAPKRVQLKMRPTIEPARPDKVAPRAEGKPVEKLTPEMEKEAERLIGKLGDNSFQVRSDAYEELEGMGPAILPVLKKHTESDDFEVKTRIERLIAKFESGDVDVPADGAGMKMALVQIAQKIKTLRAENTKLETAIAEIKEAGGNAAKEKEIAQIIARNEARIKELTAKRTKLINEFRQERMKGRQGAFQGRLQVQAVRPAQAVPLNKGKKLERMKEKKAAENKKGAEAAGLTEEQTKTAKALIEKLGADDFQTREKATEALFEMGRGVVPLLKAHKNADDVEVRNRVESLLERFEGQAGAGGQGEGNANVIILENGLQVQMQGDGPQKIEGVLPNGGAFKIQVQGGAVKPQAKDEEKEKAEEEGIEPEKE